VAGVATRPRLRAARAGGGLHEPAHPGRRDGSADSGGPRAVPYPGTPARRSRDGDVGRLRRAEILARSADDAARHHQWEVDPTCAPPGGESLAAVQARVIACVRDLAERHAGAAVVLVSHVGPIKVLLCTAMDVPLTTGQRLFLDNATVSVMDWGAHAVPWEAPAIVRLVNAHHRLGWMAAPWMQRTEAM
jgi:broad specificity phosphatase PhoE